jgi:hypothetical protein
VADRVETTGTVWLGMTIGCARCHNHKFDPFSHEEFYKLFAFFNNVPEQGRAVKYGNSPPFILAPTRVQQEQMAALQSSLSRARTRWQALASSLEEVQARWERGLRAGLVAPAIHEDHPSTRFSFEDSLETVRLADWAGRQREPRFVSGPIGMALALDGKEWADAGDVGAFGFLDRFTLSGWIRPADPGLGDGPLFSRTIDEPRGEGYSVELQNGRVHVNLVKRWLDDAIRLRSVAIVPVKRWTHLAVTYDGSRKAAGVGIFIDGRRVRTEVLLDELQQTFLAKNPFRIGGGGSGEAGIGFQGAIDEVRIDVAVLTDEQIAVLATPEPIDEIAEIPRSNRTPGQVHKLRLSFLETPAGAEFRAARNDLIALEERKRALFDHLPTVMVMEEMAAPRVTHVQVRGQYDHPGATVEPGVPACLPPWPEKQPRNRLGLARWLVDPANPLTARVEVNRQWQMLFGAGLVRTAEDFGAQGESPSHPELLDWLACELVRSGWDIKSLLRLMVTSSTYRQASRIAPALAQSDPDNRLLARGPRVRLSAEMIRDQALFLSGLLVERLGGPSVKPYQPPGLWNDLSDARYVQDHGPSLYRRGLYTFWKRTVAPPAMAAFDAPTRETCLVRESRTNTPLQALVIMNDPTFVEAARELAARVLRERRDSPERRIDSLFRMATGRHPGPEEGEILVAGFRDQQARFLRASEAARALVQTGEKKPSGDLDAVELAAYTAVAQVILNLDEMINKE